MNRLIILIIGISFIFLSCKQKSFEQPSSATKAVTEKSFSRQSDDKGRLRTRMYAAKDIVRYLNFLSKEGIFAEEENDIQIIQISDNLLEDVTDKATMGPDREDQIVKYEFPQVLDKFLLVVLEIDKKTDYYVDQDFRRTFLVLNNDKNKTLLKKLKNEKNLVIKSIHSGHSHQVLAVQGITLSFLDRIKWYNKSNPKEISHDILSTTSDLDKISQDVWNQFFLDPEVP